MITANDVKFNGMTFDEAKEYVKRKHAEEVHSAKMDLERLCGEIDDRMAELQQNAETLAALANAGFDVFAMVGMDVHLIVGVADLPRVRNAVGNLRAEGKNIADKSDVKQVGLSGDCVRVRLKTDAHPGLCVWLIRPLRPEDPCQIVTETTTARRLVCGLKEPGPDPELGAFGVSEPSYASQGHDADEMPF